MAANLTTLAEALKRFQIDGMNQQLNMQSVLYNRLWKSQQADVEGKSYTYFVQTSRNQSAGRGISDGGSYGTPGNPTGKNPIVPGCILSVGVEISGPFLRAARTNVGAFVRQQKFVIDSAQTDFIRSINRQLHSDGTDAFAFWTTGDNGSPGVVDDGQGNAFVHLDNAVGTYDLIATSDNSTKHGDSITVTLGAENANDYSISWGGTVASSADGDYLVMEDTLGLQLMGIRGVISAVNPPLLSGGLQGLDVATETYWKAQVFSNPSGAGTVRELTLPLMQRPLSQIGVRTNYSEADVKFLMCNAQVKDKYIALCEAGKVHYNTMQLDGGQTSVTFNGKELIVDPQCRRNTLYYIVPKSLDILTSSDGLTWADFEGTGQFQKKPGSGTWSDAYQAFMVFYGQLATKARNANAVLLDIDEAIS